MLHSQILPTDNHPFYKWTYASASARLAETALTEPDCGKIAWETDTNSFWVLTSVRPITWVAIGTAGAPASSANAANAIVARDAAGNFSAGTINATINGSLAGNADTASRLANARAITLTGVVSGTASFDGTSNITITTAANADSIALGTDTTGNYVAIGAVSGNGLSGSASSEGSTFTVSSNATANNSPSTIVFRDGSGNFSAGTITATQFVGPIIGDIVGNASSTTKWATARTITVNGSNTGSITIDGTANATLTLAPVANAITLGADTSGSYVASAAVTGNGLTASGGTGEGSTFTVSSNATASNAPNTIVYRDGSGNFTANVITAARFDGPINGSVTGGSANADKLTTARTIALSGDVTGSTTFDGSADVTITTTVTVPTVILGTGTYGDYVANIGQGTGVTVTGGTGAGSSPTISIGQDVATTAAPSFAGLTLTGAATSTGNFSTSRTVSANAMIAGSISLSAGTSLTAPLRIPHGVAPAAATDGDLWTTTAGLYGRINGTTALFTSEAAMKSYVDANDYTNRYPQAGLLTGENEVPVYSDFKFALGAGGSSSFTLIDRDSKQVVYYVANTPTGKLGVFRAYRFTTSDAFIFDNNPIAPSFLNAGESVQYVLNAGTFFAVLSLASATAPYSYTRTVIANTHGSSKSSDWTLAHDVSSLRTGTSNFAMVTTNGVERVLRVTYTGNTTLEVYDSSLTLLRSQVLLNASTDIDYTDNSGQNRTNAGISFGYNPYSAAFPFTWNPFTETFHQKNSGYYVAITSGGAKVGTGYALSISWTIPSTWLASGNGTPTNLITTKNGSYRYNAYSDGTWDTVDGGMSTGYGSSGQATALTTDEYSGEMYMTVHGTWSYNNGGTIYKLNYNPGSPHHTFGGGISSSVGYSAGLPIPDGSPWSKSINIQSTLAIGDQLSFIGGSTQNGNTLVYATFSTSQFGTTAIANDTLKLDSTNAYISADASMPTVVRNTQGPGNFGTTVVAGTPTYYWTSPGQLVYTATAAGATRTWTATTLTMPAIPTTISGFSGLSNAQNVVWNGSTSSPVFFALVRSSTSFYMAKYASGAWTIPSGATILQSQVDAGNSNRGDVTYAGNGNISTNLWTENGRFIFEFSVPVTGGTSFYTITYNTNTNAIVVDGSPSPFASQRGNGGGNFTATSPYSGSSFGYNQYFGYYAIRTANDNSSIRIMGSNDVTGVGAAISEDTWYTTPASRYEVAVSTESATGLVAYITSYPIFLGGYFTSVPNTSVTLTPNATNYIFATKSTADRTTVAITTSTTQLPNSFSRVCIAAVTTDADSVISSQTFAHTGNGLPVQTGSTGMILATDGKYPYWKDVSTLAASLTSFVNKSGDTMTGNLTINGALSATTKNFLITHPTKPDMTLRYGSLEGPENGVYIRGKTTSSVIELPEYWTKLVDPNSITVSLTAIGSPQDLIVAGIWDNKVFIINSADTGAINCYYHIFAERCDVEKLQVEAPDRRA